MTNILFYPTLASIYVIENTYYDSCIVLFNHISFIISRVKWEDIMNSRWPVFQLDHISGHITRLRPFLLPSVWDI